MIHFQQAAGWELLLAPLALVFSIALLVKVRQVRRRGNNTPEVARGLSAFRVSSYLGIVVFVVMLSFWVGLILAVRFDWNRQDVSELEIQVFPSPDPRAGPQRVVTIRDAETVARLLESLALFEPYYSNHEHAVGRRYLLRLRRRSDGQWSDYRVGLYPDHESPGGPHMRGVYVVSIDFGSHWFNLGGDHQATEFGRLVEQLAQKTMD